MKINHISFSFLAILAFAGCKSSMQTKTEGVNFPTFDAEAHRGGRGLMPENTIMAMKNAMTMDKVTTLEMDTHITKDGKVVVTHDDYLSPAFMLTPDGNNISKADAKKYVIFGMNYNELKAFDLGTKYYDLFPRQKKVKTHISLLSDLIDSVQNDIKVNHRKQFFYNIETKCSEKGDGITNPEPEKFVELLLGIIMKKNIMPYVIIQSFDKRTLQIINKKYPTVHTSFIVSNTKSYDENIADLGFKPFILSPLHTTVDAEMMSKAHADRVKIVAWTANTAEEIKKLKDLKVDGIITDYPDLF